MKNKRVVVESKLHDFLNTAKMIPMGLQNINNACGQSTKKPEDFHVNKIAAFMHPDEQSLVIKKVVEHSPDVKSFFFTWLGSKPLAYFRAGQYLTLKIKIGSAVLTRPYSISSSPAAALKGEYQITVKRVADGFASGYILDNWKAGDKVTAYAPEGCFVYEPLRDTQHIIGIAGGCGITPFISLAKAIDDKIEDCSLTLLYGCKTKQEILFKNELDELQEKNDKIKVVYVLSDDKSRGFEKGFIDAEKIKKYAPKKGDYSLFVCGPQAMYDFLKDEIAKLNIRQKFVRFEAAETKKPSAADDFPKGMARKTFELTVINRGESQTIKCKSSETILTALERAGIQVPSRCRGGGCGFCRSKIVSGEFFIAQGSDKRRIADAEFGYIHPCCAYPISDIELKIN